MTSMAKKNEAVARDEFQLFLHVVLIHVRIAEDGAATR